MNKWLNDKKKLSFVRGIVNDFNEYNENSGDPKVALVSLGNAKEKVEEFLKLDISGDEKAKMERVLDNIYIALSTYE